MVFWETATAWQQITTEGLVAFGSELHGANLRFLTAKNRVQHQLLFSCTVFSKCWRIKLSRYESRLQGTSNTGNGSPPSCMPYFVGSMTNGGWSSHHFSASRMSLMLPGPIGVTRMASPLPELLASAAWMPFIHTSAQKAKVSSEGRS